MNIFELESFNLADAVKFHSRLNHRLWDSAEHLHPQVKERLLQVARDFQEFLGVPDLDVKDITVSGSNAAYNYTDHSDIDLHLVVDIPDVVHNEVYRELFNAKKYQYNDQHNIRIGGADVELYAQPSDQAHHSQGIYSLLRNAWIQVPRRKRSSIDDTCVQAKFEDLAARVDDAVDSGDVDRLRSLQQKIKTMRQTGLEQQGEFGCDNLAFKLLRARGYIQRLIDARNQAHAAALSLAEKNAPMAPVIYGFMTESPDGVDPSTKMFLEHEPTDTDAVVRDFIDYAADRLGITQMPQIELHTDPEWSSQSHSFGRYTPETHTLEVSLVNRHVMDILRTTAHELAHCRQNQDQALPDEAGETGSDWENQAHAVAGVIMRDWADRNPTMFESSGYIPTKAERNDPRFLMALSPDVQPGATGLNANRMSLKTDAQGRPQLLRANGKVKNVVEYRMPQPSQGPNSNRDLNAPLGPETPPTMPAGTVRVDVSDVYDWYKLGQHISNMKGLGRHDFGAGPPSAILSFGDEDLEHQYIDALKKTGLSTTDIDPVDPDQPADMPRQKTDPTYNVDEAQLGTVLQWPEVVNKINSAMKATGWKGQRQSDDAFMFSTKGQLDDEFYMVIIENAGEGFFTYALGTVEEGDPYIDDAYKGKLPNTEASVSELINDIRDGFGLNEQGVAEGKQPGKPVVDAILKVIPVAQEIWFHGSRATGKHRKNSDTDILVVVPDDLVGDQYLAVVRILQKLSTQFDNYDIQPTKLGTNIHRIAQEEGQLLWSKTNENFADGRNPQDKGDAKRHGINTKASVSSLRKTAKSGGRKGQLAHWLANMKSGRANAKRKNESIAEVRINNASGVGAVPYNADVDYFGLQVQMRPSMFLKLALPMDPHDPEERKAIAFCKGELNERGFGAPFLNVSVPEAWEQGDFSLEARVKGHDGRHRCHAILEKEGDDAVEMHIFIAQTRRKDITDEMIENLRNGILNQLGQFVRGPIFGEAK
jgi:predicted nucleotidyltransferase